MKTKITILSIDIHFQAFIMFLNTLLIVVGILNPQVFILILLLQFFIGLYQFLISAPVHLILDKSKDAKVNRYRTSHLITSFFYLLFLILFGSMFQGAYKGIEFSIFFILIPQLLAYGYFLLNYIDYKARKNYIQNREAFQLR